jgi:5-methylthioadenosine/S-adenosylhomocysteine deaminase
MRLAALIQAPRLGPGALSAETVFALATIEGARALGLDGLVGSIEPGKRADLVIVNPRALHAVPAGNLYGTLVFATRADQVETVIVDGEVLVAQSKLVRWDETEVLAEAEAALARTVARMR